MKYRTLETIARRLHSVQELFWEIPKSKYIFQRFKIYEFIISNNKNLAVDFYNYFLNNEIVEKNHSHIITHFNKIFNNFTITRSILLKKYISMKEELVYKAFSLYIQLLERNELIIIKKIKTYIPDHLLSIYDRTIYDYIDMMLLDGEKEMMNLINQEINSAELNKKYFSILEKEILDFQVSNDTCFDEVFNLSTSCDLYNNESSINHNNKHSTNYTTDSSVLLNNLDSGGNLETFNEYMKYNSSSSTNTRGNGISDNFFNNNIYNYGSSNNLNYSYYQDTCTLNIRKYIINCDDDIIIRTSNINKNDYDNIYSNDTDINGIINKNSLIYYLGIPEHHFPLKNKFSIHIFLGINSHNLFMKTYNINIKSNLILNNSNNINENKIKKFKLNNEFLKDFNPKFVKKEVLDKVIIRRFNKYLKSKYKGCKEYNEYKGLKEKDDKGKENNINNIISSKYSNISNINRTIHCSYSKDSIIKFISGNLIPPFRHNHEYYSSFSTKYLIFLFSQDDIKDSYNEFIENIGEAFIKLIIDKYDVKNKQIRIIESLRYYIENLNNIYNFNFLAPNDSIDFNAYIKENTNISSIKHLARVKTPFDIYKYLDYNLDFKRNYLVSDVQESDNFNSVNCIKVNSSADDINLSNNYIECKNNNFSDVDIESNNNTNPIHLNDNSINTEFDSFNNDKSDFEEAFYNVFYNPSKNNMS